MDPFLDLVRLLQPKCTLWGKTQATGRWGLGFHKRDDLLFCWIQEGYCLLTRPEAEPVHLRRDDFILIRTIAPFTLTTDPKLEPEDSEVLARSGPQGTGNKLGSGRENPVVLRGGRFVFDSANEDLLTGLIPPFVHIEATQSVSWRVRCST
jgi:Cupin